MSENAAHTARELIRDIAQFTRDPARFVRYNYPWGQEGTALEPHSGPRAWQDRVLSIIKKHLSDKKTRFTPCKICVKSGHGIGKTAFIAWIFDWAMSTFEDTRGFVTANTDTQLRTKTWPEISKWFGLGLNKHWFEVKKESIVVRTKAHEDTWRIDRVNWNENNPEAIAGCHNEGKRIVIAVDEGSSIPRIIMETLEGALTDENTEIILIVFGNPTLNTGFFHDVFTKQAHRWHTFTVDSREVEGTNKDLITQWAEDYGEDSDFFRIRVKGEFPRSGSNQFIPSDIVALARRHQAVGYERLPKMLAVDVARFGEDRSTWGVRQGRKFTVLKKVRGWDVVQVANQTIEYIESELPDATIIDGDGIGAGVVDIVKSRGFGGRLFEFHGGAAANDANKYFNRRAEVWGNLLDWLKSNAQIDDDPELDADLTGIQYGFDAKGRIQLEKKDDMKRRGLSSPDLGDTAAMTFAVNVAVTDSKPKPQFVYSGQRQQSWMA